MVFYKICNKLSLKQDLEAGPVGLLQPHGTLIRSWLGSMSGADMTGNGEVSVCNDISQVYLANAGTASCLGECVRLTMTAVGGKTEAGGAAADVAVAQTATRS